MSARELATCPACGHVGSHGRYCAGSTRRLDLEGCVWRLREARGNRGVDLRDVDAVCSALLHSFALLEEAQEALASASEVLDGYADAEYVDGRPHGNREMTVMTACNQAHDLIERAVRLPDEAQQ